MRLWTVGSGQARLSADSDGRGFGSAQALRGDATARERHSRQRGDGGAEPDLMSPATEAEKPDELGDDQQGEVSVNHRVTVFPRHPFSNRSGCGSALVVESQLGGGDERAELDPRRRAAPATRPTPVDDGYDHDRYGAGGAHCLRRFER